MTFSVKLLIIFIIMSVFYFVETLSPPAHLVD